MNIELIRLYVYLLKRGYKVIKVKKRRGEVHITVANPRKPPLYPAVDKLVINGN